MPRLVTFGCSHVYGHGLPDCHIEPDWPGLNPSKFAWPQLLADKLGYECINLAEPGIGNFEILMKIIKTNFLIDDIVITAWSYFDRFDFYKINDLEGNGIRFGNPSEEYKKIILNQSDNTNYLEQNYWNNWLTIQHAELILNSKNIKNFSYIGIQKRLKIDLDKPKLISLNNFFNDIELVSKDKALDNSHSGTISHRVQTKLIYNKIIDRIK